MGWNLLRRKECWNASSRDAGLHEPNATPPSHQGGALWTRGSGTSHLPTKISRFLTMQKFYSKNSFQFFQCKVAAPAAHFPFASDFAVAICPPRLKHASQPATLYPAPRSSGAEVRSRGHVPHAVPVYGARNTLRKGMYARRFRAGKCRP